MIKELYIKVDGRKRAARTVRVPGKPSKVGDLGELSGPERGKVGRKQCGSDKNSTRVGQGPKDRGLEKLDNIAENRKPVDKTPFRVKDRKRKKPSRRATKGNGRLVKGRGRGLLRVQAIRLCG